MHDGSQIDLAILCNTCGDPNPLGERRGNNQKRNAATF